MALSTADVLAHLETMTDEVGLREISVAAEKRRGWVAAEKRESEREANILYALATFPISARVRVKASNFKMMKDNVGTVMEYEFPVRHEYAHYGVNVMIKFDKRIPDRLNRKGDGLVTYTVTAADNKGKGATYYDWTLDLEVIS